MQPLNRYAVARKLRQDAVIAFHTALEVHGIANQVFQTVYYLSSRPRGDVSFEGVVYHRVAPPRALLRGAKAGFQVEMAEKGVLVTERERSFVDCLLLLEHSGGRGA